MKFLTTLNKIRPAIQAYNRPIAMFVTIVGTASAFLSFHDFKISRKEAVQTEVQINNVQGSIDESTLRDAEPRFTVSQGVSKDDLLREFGLDIDLLIQNVVAQDTTFECNSGCRSRFRFHSAFILLFEATERLIVILELPSDSDAHAATAIVSVLEFGPSESGWNLIGRTLGAFEWGSWGTLDAARINVIPIGKLRFGVQASMGFTQGSGFEESTAILTKVGGRYRIVLHHQSEIYLGYDFNDQTFDYDGEDHVQSSFNFEKSEKPFYRMIMREWGNTRASGNFDHEILFNFDGYSYTSETEAAELLNLCGREEDRRCSFRD